VPTKALPLPPAIGTRPGAKKGFLPGAVHRAPSPGAGAVTVHRSPSPSTGRRHRAPGPSPSTGRHHRAPVAVTVHRSPSPGTGRHHRAPVKITLLCQKTVIKNHSFAFTESFPSLGNAGSGLRKPSKVAQKVAQPQLRRSHCNASACVTTVSLANGILEQTTSNSLL